MASFMNEFEHLQVPLEEIITATNNFDHNFFIGGGGFGKVYKGALARHKEGSIVAFKRLDRKYGQGDPEFWKEIRMLSRYTHENLISLLGFCSQGKEMILVYEYASLGSLDGHLNSAKLTWTQRLRVCLDAAKGLNHLHDPRETHQRVIHCDIKSANILLDDQWNAKVADFGLSKIGPANQQYSILVTEALGTAGYCDPEFMKTYTLTKESDVYSFGVVLFEVLCGRLCLEKINGRLNVLVSEWKKSYQEKKLEEIIFEDLMPKMDVASLEAFSDIAFQCLKDSREERPAMSLVVQGLEAALKCQELSDLRWINEFEEIVNSAVSPLIFKSLQELKVLLSKGLFVNGGKTWFSLNDNGEHHETISITECLVPLKDEDYSFQFSSDCNSRFGIGCYLTYGEKFQARVITQFLSPLITYSVNLIFKFRGGKEEKRPMYLPLKYKYEGETKLLMVDLVGKNAEQWLIAKLHQFTSGGKTIVLDFLFEDHSYCNGLEIESIQFQPMKNAEHHTGLDLPYEEILNFMEPLMIYKAYKSVEELKGLLSKGVLLNEGKMWFLLNDKEKNYKMISIGECLLPFHNGDDSSRFSSQCNSRFEVGCYSTRGKKFKTRVRTQFLSPMVTYRVNLVFKFMDKKDVKIPGYLPLKYKIKGETKILIAYVAENKEDEWLIAKLYEFTNDGEIFDLKFSFEDHSYCNGLEIEGIEFQPTENVDHHQVLELQYQEILKVAVVPVMYRSVDDVKVFFSKGILFNGGKTWFSINENGEHSEFISIAECLVPEAGKIYDYTHDSNSRFSVGALRKSGCYFKTCLRPQFLSPHITYTVNLVFKFDTKYESSRKQHDINIGYQLEGHEESSIVSMAYKREDKWWTAELCQFTSDGPTFSLDITFYGYYHYGEVIVEGIEFQPLEKLERQVPEDEKPTDIQLPISESNDNETYWEQMLPNDYRHIIKQSKDKLQWTTKKKLYSIFSKGFLIVNNRSFSQQLFNTGDQQWFSLDKSGKKCLTLSLRRACTLELPSYYKYTWQSLPESRFGEALVIDSRFKIKILLQNGKHVLSPQTRYASCLVYKLPEDRSRNKELCVMKVSDTGYGEDWYIFLHSPQTPVVRPKVGENTFNPAARRPKIKDLPQQRSDGWMEVKLYEFQIDTASKGVIPNLELTDVWGGESLKGTMIQCIEIRQI